VRERLDYPDLRRKIIDVHRRWRNYTNSYALLIVFFDDRKLAHLECDRLNAHQGNPHIRYSIRCANPRRAQSAA
jgi:hypothetical protein